MHRLLLPLVGLSALVACGDPADPVGDTGGVDCDTMFTYAATVHLIDPDGASFDVDDAVVQYAVDGESGDCQSISPGTYGCGYEAGEYTITASHDGYEGSVEVAVPSDMCGAINTEAALTLYAID